ncbi:sulfite exporter TauE/SafE family protein [Muricauda sp. NFXS6]|uniref:sulfite exporter TauE/SafE family protein n=1 Tax=Allomuricauda sp. NFXS6 TaxID=2819094 RepID=UPI0032DF2CFF
METFQLIGYAGAFIIGLVMGITGSGGSAMAVPIFNYIFLMDMHSTTSHSLFVVGMSAATGVLLNYKRRTIDWRLALYLSIPMVVSVFLVRKYILPMIPTVLFEINIMELQITRDMVIMVFFGLLMAVGAILSIKRGKASYSSTSDIKKGPIFILLMGVGIGAITGITGTGGGFLIVPVLVVFLQCSMKKAIVTSLMIIALKSFVGFIGDLGSVDIDWILLLGFTAISITGLAIGIYSSQRIGESNLKKGYAYVILSISILVVGRELIHLV